MSSAPPLSSWSLLGSVSSKTNHPAVRVQLHFSPCSWSLLGSETPTHPSSLVHPGRALCCGTCDPVWPGGKALGFCWSRGTSVRIRFGSPFSSKVVVWGHCLVTLSLTINETSKWLSSLPTLMQESFWWWQCSDRYIISFSPHLPTPFPPCPCP